MQLLDTLARLGAPARPDDSAVATVQGRTRRFGIHVDRASAPPVHALLQQRYAWRGLRAGLPAPADRITFAARAGRATVGTVSVVFDGPAGLAADTTFGDLLAPLRRAGQRLCEFTRLAVDAGGDAPALLAGLFHVAYIAAHRLRAAGTLLMEVHPRHVRFYERLLGCRAMAGERAHAHVQAPAVLLAAEAADVRARLRACRTAHPLVRQGFTAEEEHLVLCRLLMMPGQPGARPAD